MNLLRIMVIVTLSRACLTHTDYSYELILNIFFSNRNLDITLQKELLSMKDENRNQRMLEEKIQKLQDKVCVIL